MSNHIVEYVIYQLDKNEFTLFCFFSFSLPSCKSAVHLNGRKRRKLRSTGMYRLLALSILHPCSTRQCKVS